MGEGIKDYVEDFYLETEDIDEEYEYDAPKFFDFTRPESSSEIQEAERWFEFSGECPPSPFVVILNLENLFSMEVLSDSSKSTCVTNTNSISCGSDANSRNGVLSSKKNAKGKGCLMPKNNAKTKLKSADELYQPRSPTLLKPTVSHLLKQQKVHDTHSSRLCSRLRRITSKSDQKGLANATGIDNLEVKRQKLENGCLKKVTQLKHHFSLLHKSSKKVTVPREPELQTLLRAQDRKASGGAVSGGIDKKKQKGCSFSLHPFNTRLFHLKNKDRADHHASAKVHPSAKDVDLSKTRSEKATMSKDFRLTRNNELMEGPPVAQLSELSLGSDMKDRGASLKGYNAKSDQCGGHIRTDKVKC